MYCNVNPKYYFSIVVIDIGVCSFIVSALAGSTLGFGFAMGSLCVGLVTMFLEFNEK